MKLSDPLPLFEEESNMFFDMSKSHVRKFRSKLHPFLHENICMQDDLNFIYMLNFNASKINFASSSICF